MGFPKKLQVDTSLDSDGKKWVIAGISIRASLKPINTKPKPRQNEEEEEEDNNIEDEEECSTTPTAKESRIPDRLPCPPAPRKRRPSLKCRAGGVSREFFNPPDLESVFQRRVERT